MTVDVVVVNYRSGEKLSSCLTAAQRLLGDDATLIVVDNSPGDGSAADAMRSHPHLTLLESDGNVGFAAAVNRGVGAGCADLVLLLNPDVADISGKRHAVEAVFSSDRHVAALSPRLLNGDGTVQRSARRAPTLADYFYAALGVKRPGPRGWDAHYYLDEWDYASSRVVDTVFGACLFVRRAALEDVGLFDERFFVYAEETDWLLRAKRKGWKTVFLADVEATHRIRGSTGATEETLALLLLEAQYRYAQKHFGRTKATLLRGAVALIDLLRLARASFRGRDKAGHRRFLRMRLKLHVTGRTPHPA